MPHRSSQCGPCLNRCNGENRVSRNGEISDDSVIQKQIALIGLLGREADAHEHWRNPYHFSRSERVFFHGRQRFKLLHADRHLPDSAHTSCKQKRIFAQTNPYQELEQALNVFIRHDRFAKLAKLRQLHWM